MKPKMARHIVVIRLSALGDVAMTVPVLKVLTATYPDLNITVISKAFFKPLFEDLPNCRFLAADVTGKHKGLGIFKLAKEALQADVDAVADLHGVIRSQLLSFYFKFKGIKVQAIDKGRQEKKALINGKSPAFKPLKTTHQRYADVFRALGFPIDLEKSIPASPKRLAPQLTALLGVEPKKIIGIAPFAAHHGKMYPLNLMEEVIKTLDHTDRYRIFLFGGGKKEKEQLDRLASQYKNTTSLVGKFDFRQELAFISNLDVMLSMDSGNGHLAALYGAPVITLWGVTHPFAGFAPFNQPEAHQLLADRDKFPLIPTSIYGNHYPEGYDKVMESISPTDVVKKITAILD